MRIKLTDSQYMLLIQICIGIFWLASLVVIPPIMNRDTRTEAEKAREHAENKAKAKKWEDEFWQGFLPLEFKGVVTQKKDFDSPRINRARLVKIALRPIDSLGYSFENDYFIRESHRKITLALSRYTTPKIEKGDTLIKIAGEDSLVIRPFYRKSPFREEKIGIEHGVFGDYRLNSIPW